MSDAGKVPPGAVWRLVRASALRGRAPRDMFLGEGAENTAGRWHLPGTRVAYCSISPATTMLEVLVHASPSYLRQEFVALRANLPPDTGVETLQLRDLPEGWSDYPPATWTQERGTAWARSNHGLALVVPSAVVPLEQNVILNPGHSDMARVAVERVATVRFDPRIVAAWNLDNHLSR